MVEVKCLNCGKVIRKFPCQVGKYNYCSLSCFQKARSQNSLISTECDYCGKPMQINRCCLTYSKHHFCNKDCFIQWQRQPLPSKLKSLKISVALKGKQLPPEHVRKIALAQRGKVGMVGKANPASWPENREAIREGQQKRYQNHRIDIACPQCGKATSKALSDVKRGRKFCSEKCYLKWIEENKSKFIEMTRPHHRLHPNKPEQKLLDILDTYFPNEWEYTGDGTVVINDMKPDFTNRNGLKEVIELFGDFYHSEDWIESWKDTELGKIMAYAYMGFRCLVIWEHEINELPKESIINRIKKFRRLRCKSHSSKKLGRTSGQQGASLLYHSLGGLL